MFLAVISALSVIFTAIAQGLADGVINLSGSGLQGLKDDTNLLNTPCVYIGVQAGSILSCFAVAAVHSRVRLLQAVSCVALVGRGIILLILPIYNVTGPTAHAVACIIGACQSVVEIAIYSRTGEAVFSSSPHMVIYLFGAFSSLGQLLAATVAHMEQPNERSLLYVAGGATPAIAAVFCVVLTFAPASPPVLLTASKCRVILTAIGVFSSTALTSFALRNIPHLLERRGEHIDEDTGQHLVGLFHIAFTLSRFAVVFLSFRLSSFTLWFYSALLIIPSILLVNFSAHCGTTIAILVFGCCAGPLYPTSIGSLTTSGPLSPFNVTLLVLIARVAECIRMLKTDLVHIVLMGLALLCLGSGALKRLSATCTWRPDTIIKMLP